MFTEDFDIYFVDFGESATYTAGGGSSADITVIFDNQAFAINMASGEISDSRPRATCKTSDVSNAKNGDTITIRTVSYTVTDVNPDGTGITELVLRKT
jgi:hypothetical protein